MYSYFFEGQPLASHCIVYITLQGKVEPADVMISEVSAEIPLREKCERPKVTLRDMMSEATEKSKFNAASLGSLKVGEIP